MKQCLSYQPCSLLKEFENKHGSKIDLVNRKCAKSNIAKGGNERDDCESICQSRSCCFFAPSNLNCRDENKVCTKRHTLQNNFSGIETNFLCQYETYSIGLV